MILGSSVRQVLSFVESGSAALGIVFLSDMVSASAATTGRVKMLHVFPAEALRASVVYPAAVLAASERQADGVRLLNFFRSGYARDSFIAAGFGMP